MKKVILLSVILLGFIGTQQAQTLDHLFDKYCHNEKFTYVSVGKGMMNTIKNYADFDEETEDMIPTSVKILTLEEVSTGNAQLAKQIISEIMSIMNSDNFEKILEVSEKGEATYIYSKEYDDKNCDQLLLDITDDEVSIIWTRGKKSK